MKFRILAHISAAALIALAFAESAAAQDNNAPELIPDKKLEQRGQRISGPITSITAAGLLFASFDKNGDYQTNGNELSQGIAVSFKTADRDQSGTVSMFELEDWRQIALGSLDAAPGNISFDKDYDQRVTPAEFNHALNYVFNAQDKNKDGTLTFEEMVRVFEMPRRGRFGANSENNPGARQGRQGQGRQGQGRQGQGRRR